MTDSTKQNLRRALLALLAFAAAVLLLLTPRDTLRVERGQQVGPVHATLSDGADFELAGHGGEVVVLNFWASWCEPCRAEVPALSRLHGDGVKVVGLSVEDLSPAQIGAHARSLGIRYPVGLPEPEVLSRLGVTTVPTTCIIGRDGTLRAAHTGLVSEATLRAELAAAR